MLHRRIEKEKEKLLRKIETVVKQKTRVLDARFEKIQTDVEEYTSNRQKTADRFTLALLDVTNVLLADVEDLSLQVYCKRKKDFKKDFCDYGRICPLRCY